MTNFIILHKAQSGDMVYVNPDNIVRMYDTEYSHRRPKEMRGQRTATIECVNTWYEVREWTQDILELIKKAPK